MTLNYMDFLNQKAKQEPQGNNKYIFVVNDEQLAEIIFMNGFFAIPVTENNITEFLQFLESNSVTLTEALYLDKYVFMLASTKYINTAILEAINTLHLNANSDAWKIFNQKNKNLSYFKQISNSDDTKNEIEKFITMSEGQAKIIDSFCNLSVVENAYVKYVKDIPISVSNFIIEPIEVVLINGRGTLHANIKTNFGTYETRIPDTAISHINKFKAYISEGFKKLYFKGNERDFEDVKMLYGNYDYPIKRGVRTKGVLNIGGVYHFVDSNMTVNANGQKNDDYIFAQEYEVIKTDILKFEAINTEELQSISNSLFKFNELPKTLIILGFCCSCFLKVQLKEANCKLNHLFLIGEAGSGKSTTLDYIIRPFFSLVNNSFSAKNITKFSAIKTASSSNTIPFVIDEFKPYQLSTAQVNMILDLIRNIYDGHTAPRGRADQTLEEYVLESPLILAGEAGNDEPSIIERTLILSYSKADITPEMTEAIDTLKQNSNLIAKLGRAILNMSLDISNISSLHAVYKHMFQKEIKNHRIADAATNCYLGLYILQLLFLNLEVEFPVGENDVPKIITDYIMNEMLDEQEQPKTAVEEILEYMDLIASENPNYEGLYYQIEETTLYLDIKGFYPIFTEYMQRHNVKGVEILEQKQFTKQLKSAKKYVTKYSMKRFKNSINKRAYFLNLKEVEKLDTRVFRISDNKIEYPNTHDNPFEIVK